MVMPARFRGVRIALWIVTAAIGVAVAAELGLQYRAARLEGLVANDGTRLAQLDRAYLPFTVQHLHPHFLFFFPLQPADRVAMGNAVCSIDADGYREPGPAHAGGRKLAVMLGSSAAFGHYASSNDTTITSFLNRLQDEYFFVNAGVPSWNSTQSLIRLATQVIDLRPALVLSYDGINEAALIGFRNDHRPELHYPPGTPESFDLLQNAIEDLRRPRERRLRGLFPQLANRADKYFSGPKPPDREPPFSAADVAAAADRYLTNLTRMATLAQGGGARFVAVFQPVGYLHRHVDANLIGGDARMGAFHAAVMARDAQPFEFHDLSSIFDDHFKVVPVRSRSGDIADDTIFVDAAHITDRGSEIVAARLRDLLRSPAPALTR